MLALANLGYENSNIPLKVKLFCYEKAPGLQEIADSYTAQLNAFQVYKGESKR